MIKHIMPLSPKLGLTKASSVRIAVSSTGDLFLFLWLWRFFDVGGVGRNPIGVLRLLEQVDENMGNLEVPWCWRCRAFGTEEKYEDDKWPSWWILDANEKGQCRAVHCVKDDGLEIENWWTGYATVPSELLALCRVVSFRILSFSYSFNNYVSSLTVQFVQIWTAPSFA